MPTAGRAFCAALSPGRPEASSDGMKARAAFSGAPQDVPNRQGGKGSVGGPCCRRGPQVLPSRYGVPLLTVRSVRRSFPLPRRTLRDFPGVRFVVFFPAQAPLPQGFRRVFSAPERPGAFIRRLLPGKGHPRRSLFFRHTCLAACGNRWAFMKASRGFNPESPRPFPGGGFLSAHGRYGTCCGVMPSRRFRDFPRPCAVLLRQEREEGEYLHRFSGARRAAGRIFLCLPRQRPR